LVVVHREMTTRKTRVVRIMNLTNPLAPQVGRDPGEVEETDCLLNLSSNVHVAICINVLLYKCDSKEEYIGTRMPRKTGRAVRVELMLRQERVYLLPDVFVGSPKSGTAG